MTTRHADSIYTRLKTLGAEHLDHAGEFESTKAKNDDIEAQLPHIVDSILETMIEEEIQFALSRIGEGSIGCSPEIDIAAEPTVPHTFNAVSPCGSDDEQSSARPDNQAHLVTETEEIRHNPIPYDVASNVTQTPVVSQSDTDTESEHSSRHSMEMQTLTATETETKTNDKVDEWSTDLPSRISNGTYATLTDLKDANLNGNAVKVVAFVQKKNRYKVKLLRCNKDTRRSLSTEKHYLCVKRENLKLLPVDANHMGVPDESDVLHMDTIMDKTCECADEFTTDEQKQSAPNRRKMLQLDYTESIDVVHLNEIKSSNYQKIRRSAKDRNAWTQDTAVEIYVDKLDRWVTGVIDRISKNDRDILDIACVLSEDQRKTITVRRGDRRCVRSKREFIAKRVQWTEGSVIEFYSMSKSAWFSAVIEAVDDDKLSVAFTDSDGKRQVVSCSRWSAKIAELEDLV